jgi:hypothetical protein
MLSVSLTPSPTSPEETLREAPSGRLTHTWVSFFFDGELPSDSPLTRAPDRYRLEVVNGVRGPQAPLWTTGQVVLRAETSGGRAPTPSPGVVIGSVDPLASSGPDVQADLARRWSESRWRVALLVPFSLSPAWWRLSREERPPVHLSWTQGDARSPIVGRALRTLYRARSLPETEWDFLAYLEMQPQDVAPIREALAELRDPRLNPGIKYVERATELWMTKDLTILPPRRI